MDDSDRAGLSPRRWHALAVGLLAGFMTLLDISIVNVALPAIREGMDASSSDLQWIVTGYSLAFGLALVPAGRLGDARSRKLVFIAGVSLFTISSLAAGLAPTPQLLVLARLLQGLGGGIVNPQITGLIQEEFRGAERGKAFGLLSAVIGVSTTIGPLLGGVIIGLLGEEIGWRWIFFVNLPVGAVCIVLAVRLLPNRPAPVSRRGQEIDKVGVLLLGSGVLCLLLPLVRERRTVQSFGLFVVGGLLLAAFVYWEHRRSVRGRTPLVDLSLFRLSSFSAGCAIGLVYFSGFTSIFFVMTLYLQNGPGYSALQAGLALTPFAVGSIGTALLGGRLVARIGRLLVVIGLLVVAAGFVATEIAITRHGHHWSVGWWTALPLLLAGLGSGLVVSPNTTLTVAEVPVPQAGAASGVVNTGQRMGTAVGVALVGAVYFDSLLTHPGDYALAASTGLRVAVVVLLLAVAVGITDVVVSARRR